MHAPAASTQTRLLVKNRGLLVWPFDEAGCASQVLCEIPAQDGKTYRLRVSAAALQKLDAFDGERTVGEVVDFHYPGNQDPAARGAFEEFVTGTCIASGLLVDRDASEEAGLSSRSNRSPMSLQRSLLGPGVVAAVARPLVALYRPWLVVLAVLAIAGGQLAVFSDLNSAGTAAVPDLALSDVCWVLVILAAGLFFHEFGHAAAAHRYGCRATRIGIGLYLCFPVFYADLSESWRLSRPQRIIVDCGGMYFQALFISFLVALSGFHSEPALTYAILALNIALLWNFNPFLKMDGYWLVSDLLGVANLRSESAVAFGSVWRRVWPHAPGRFESHGSSLGVCTQAWLCVYWIASTGFLVWIAQMIVFSTIPALWSDARMHYLALVSGLDAHGQDFLLLTAGKLAWKGGGVALMLYVLYRVSGPALTKLASGFLRARLRLLQQAAK